MFSFFWQHLTVTSRVALCPITAGTYGLLSSGRKTLAVNWACMARDLAVPRNVQVSLSLSLSVYLPYNDIYSHNAPLHHQPITLLHENTITYVTLIDRIHKLFLFFLSFSFLLSHIFSFTSMTQLWVEDIYFPFFKYFSSLKLMYDFSQSRFDWEKLIIYFLDDVLNTQIKENTFLPYKHLFLHTRTHAVIFSLKWQPKVTSWKSNVFLHSL